MKSVLSGFRVTVCALMIVIGTSSIASAILIVSMSPSSVSVQPGDTFNMDVMVSDAIDLYGIQFTVNFNSSILAADDADIVEGTFLNEGGTVSTFFLKPSTSELDVAVTRLGSVGGVGGSGILATISFNVIGSGTTPITLSNVSASDPAASPIAFSTSSATVSVVPEPISLVLLGTGLIGISALKRKK